MALLGLAACGAEPPHHLPPLLTSDPADGSALVPRTAWIRLTFATAVSDAGRESVELRCGGELRSARVHRVQPRTLIVDPVADLDPSASCAVGWRGRAGLRQVSFGTAAEAAPASVIYDRTDARVLAPFPDDYWLRPGADGAKGRLAIEAPDFGSPERLLIGALLRDTRGLDGFSPIAHITVELSEAPDPYSLPWTPTESLDPMAAVGLFDITPGSARFGERVPFRMDPRSDTAWGGVSHSLLLFPSIALEPGGRYGVVVTRRALVTPERNFDASAFFEKARDADPSDEDSPALRRIRPLVSEVLEAVAEAANPPIDRSDVALAFRFTVRRTDDIPKDLLAMKREILALPAPSFEIDSVERESAEASAAGSDVAAIVRGTWRAPDWRENGRTLRRDPATRLPLRTGSRPVKFVLALPKAALAAPVPLVMFQHGNPGSAEEDVVPQARQALARAGFAVIGFTDVINREVSPPGSSERLRAYQQMFQIMWNLLVLKQIPDYFVQTNAEQLAFLRVIDGIAAIPSFSLPTRSGEADVEAIFGIDADKPLAYVGVSEGANLGPAFLAFAPEVRAAALVAGGRRFSEVMIHQRPDGIFAPLAGLGFSQFRPTDVWVILALIQTIFDRQDAHNFAPYIYREPFEVGSAKGLGDTKGLRGTKGAGGTKRRASILLTAGLDDATIPNHATEALAWSLGPIPQLAPAARRVPTLPLAPSSVSGNIDAHTTAGYFQFVPQGIPDVAATPGCSSPPLSPKSANEGHYCVQNAVEALVQRIVFLETALTDPAPLIVNPMAAGVETPEPPEPPKPPEQ